MSARPWADLLFPPSLRKELWSKNPQERRGREIRRRTEVAGIFPDLPSIIRVVGVVLAEQHDEWSKMRLQLSLDALARARADNAPPVASDKLQAPGELEEISARRHA